MKRTIYMSNTIKPVVVKDSQYWEDVIYVLKQMAKLKYEPNEETEARIKERCGDENNFLMPDSPGEDIQDFKYELVMLISKILKNATGTSSKSPFSIYKYPEYVKGEIIILETKVMMLKAKEEKAKLLSLCE